MKAPSWSCVLGLLCLPAEVILHAGTVSQHPSDISVLKVNSSIDITCSTALGNPVGLRLQRRFHRNSEETDVLYLSLIKKRVKETTADAFKGRLRATQHTQSGEGCRFTFTLSLLTPADTDLYYCAWIYAAKSDDKHSSNGTVIIIREEDHAEQCSNFIFDVILITLSVSAVLFVLLLSIGALAFICPSFKKKFRPAKLEHTARLDRPHCVCPQQGFQPYSYLTTTGNNMNFSEMC